jgi:predicted AAA+ superfamily ATPase
MSTFSDDDLKRRLAFDNPWWETGRVPDRFRAWPRRMYFDGFWRLFAESSVRRAIVLMGPRRVGKTVLLTQAVQRLIDEGTAPARIFFASLDTPTYMGVPLEKLLNLFLEMHGHDRFSEVFVIFDEVQYLAEWEVHLKSLVDSYPDMRFAVSGSAAGARKMGGPGKGAGPRTPKQRTGRGGAE